VLVQLMGGIYEVCIGWGIEKFLGEIHRQEGDLKSLLLIFYN
jgi:hypothetical protein